MRQGSNAAPRIYSSLAQPVEHAAVNRGVVGSSPTRGAKKAAQDRKILRCFFIMIIGCKGVFMNEYQLLLRNYLIPNPSIRDKVY